MRTWIPAELDKIKNKEKVHGVVILELVEAGLAEFSGKSERLILTTKGNELIEQLESGRV